MKNIVLTLFVAPLICFMQMHADLQLFEVDPSRVIVDGGIFVVKEGVVQSVNNLVLRGKRLFAVESDAWDLDRQAIFIPLWPNDAIKHINSSQDGKRMLKVALEGDRDLDGERGEKSFMEAKGALGNVINSILKNGDRNFSVWARKGCNCKPRRPRGFIHPASGDIIISINVDTDDLNEDEIVRIYVQDEEVADFILEAVDAEEEVVVDSFIGYDDKDGAYILKKTM